MKTKTILVLCILAMTVFLQKNAFAVIVINEFLADPPTGLAGDANLDGIRSATQDEFVELLNIGGVPEDLSSWSLWDSAALRHEFPEGINLPPSERLVVFGGGNPIGIPGIVMTATSGSLSLNNSGDKLILKNGLGEVVDQVIFASEADQDQSLARFPEGVGAFDLHSTISSQGLHFSPGTDPEGKAETHVPATPEPLTTLMVGVGLLITARRAFRNRS